MAYGAILGQLPNTYTKNQIINSNVLQLYGLGTDAVPSDIFNLIGNNIYNGLGNQYLWEKNLVEATYDVDKRYNEAFLNLVNSSSTVTLYYSDEMLINTTDKTASLVNPQSITVSYTTNLSFLLGKYWSNNSNEDLSTVYYMPPDASISGPNFSAGMYNWTASEFQILSNFRGKYTFISYVNSSSPDAYPPAEPDGYTHTRRWGRLETRYRLRRADIRGRGHMVAATRIA